MGSSNLAATGDPGRPALSLDQLRTDIAAGDIDTVVVAFTDMQGRLQGKRLHAPLLPRRRRSGTAPRAATTCSPSTST